MRTVTNSYDVFQFSELSDKAKERAADHYRDDTEFFAGPEYLDSLKALAEHFGGKLIDWNVSWDRYCHSSAKFDMPDDMTGEDMAERLAQLGTFDAETLRGHGDCALTGVAYDEPAIDGFRRAFHDGERDLNKLMHAAFCEWLRAAQEDCEYVFSLEGFAETAEANEWEFLADGSLFRE